VHRLRIAHPRLRQAHPRQAQVSPPPHGVQRLVRVRGVCRAAGHWRPERGV